MRLSQLVNALKARGISEEVAKSAAIDIEDHAEESGLGGGRQTGVETAPGRGAHGFDANRQIGMSSDLAPQGTRQNEYQALAGMLSEMGSTMKSLVEAVKPKAPDGATQKADADSLLGRATRLVKLAKSAVAKAEDDEDDEDKDESVEKAARLLEKAKKLLAKAEEDDEEGEDDEKIEKARADYRQVAKSLKPLKDARDAAVAAKAEADNAAAAVTAKAEADRLAAEAAAKAEADKTAAAAGTAGATVAKTEAEKNAETVAAVKGKVDLLTASMNDVVGLISNLSRTAVLPPDLSLAKSATEGAQPSAVAPSFISQILEASDAGRLNQTEAIRAKAINSHLGLVTTGNVELAKVQAEIREAPENVRRIFAPVLAKSA